MDGRRVVAAWATVTTAVTVLAALYAATFLACVAIRLTFGFELSWMESGMQAMTARLDAQQSMYAAPSPSYVPFIYPPLYYVVAHVIGRAAPALAGPMAMRLLSSLSVLATLLVLWTVLGRRTSSLRARLLLSAAFVSFYGRFEFWHDTSRVDSLFVLWLFCALALLIEGEEIRSAVAAGVAGGLAILTKQPALPLVLAAGGVVMFTRGDARRVLWAVGVAGACAIAGLAMLGELRNPWFYYYVLTVPATHPLRADHLDGPFFVLVTMPAFVFAVVRLLRDRAAPTWLRPVAAGASVRWALMFVASVAIMSVLHLKQGASVNFFLPLVPIGIVTLAPVLSQLGSRRAELLLLVQFLVVLYNPLTAIPTARDWQAGFQLTGTLRAVPGDVFLPQFPSYLTLAGKAPVAHGVAVCDLADLRPDLMRAIDDQLQGGRFAAAFSWREDGHHEACHPDIVEPRFRSAGAVPEGTAFFSQEHGRHLGSVFRYVGAPDDPTPGGHS
jgi:hypothetical protein